MNVVMRMKFIMIFEIHIVRKSQNILASTIKLEVRICFSVLCTINRMGQTN